MHTIKAKRFQGAFEDDMKRENPTETTIKTL